MQSANGAYAEVNGLKMYYEIHGEGEPLLLLHGSFGVAEGWAGTLPVLTRSRQVIVAELQGHGRTADIDRPMTIQHLADDAAALLYHLNISSADIFGYSMGGVVALGTAIRHPDLVRKVALLGSGAGPMHATQEPESYEQLMSIVPENFNYPAVKDPYVRVAPNPDNWTTLVARMLQMIKTFEGYSDSDLASMKAQALIMLGDRDGLRPEHAVHLYRHIPDAQLAIFPSANHFVLFSNPDTVLSVLIPFLDAPESQEAAH